MIDAITKQPMKIMTSGQGGWLRVPAEQVDAVVKLFENHGLRCWRGEEVLSIDGGPARGSVFISRNEKPEIAQTILDQAS